MKKYIQYLDSVNLQYMDVIELMPLHGARTPRLTSKPRHKLLGGTPFKLHMPWIESQRQRAKQ